MTDISLLHKLRLQEDIIERSSTQSHSSSYRIPNIRSQLDLLQNSSAILRSRLQQLADKMLYTGDATNAMTLELSPRLTFHANSALAGIKAVVDRRFQEGWRSMDQRTLRRIGGEFYDTISALNMTVSRLKLTSLSEVTMRKVLYLMTDHELSMRMELAIRALNNLTQAHYAYCHRRSTLASGCPALGAPVPLKNGDPYTRDGHYDQFLIPDDLQINYHHDSKQQKQQSEYYNRMNDHLTGYMQEVLILQSELKQLYQVNSMNETKYNQAKHRFMNHAREFDHYKKLFSERIVSHSMNAIENKIERFKNLNESFVSVVSTIQSTAKSIRKKASNGVRFLQYKLRIFLQDLCDYTTDLNIGRESLRISITEKSFSRGISHLQHTIKELSGASQDIDRALIKLRNVYRTLWTEIASESTTLSFYERMRDDIAESPIDRQKLFNILAGDPLLPVETNLTLSLLNESELLARVNADVATEGPLILQRRLEAINEEFRDLQEHINIHSIMQHTGQTFLDSYQIVAKNLNNVKSESEELINDQFIRLDVI